MQPFPGNTSPLHPIPTEAIGTEKRQRPARPFVAAVIAIYLLLHALANVFFAATIYGSPESGLSVLLLGHATFFFRSLPLPIVPYLAAGMDINAPTVILITLPSVLTMLAIYLFWAGALIWLRSFRGRWLVAAASSAAAAKAIILLTPGTASGADVLSPHERLYLGAEIVVNLLIAGWLVLSPRAKNAFALDAD